MTIKERTTYFNILVGIFNIVLGLVIEFALIGASFVFLSKFPNSAESIPVSVLLPFILFAGLIIAMFISINVISWVITHFNLQDKLDQKVVRRYVKESL